CPILSLRNSPCHGNFCRPGDAMELSKRIRRPKWTDARLLVGAMLVVVAVIATYLLITTANSTTRVWASARPLVHGDVLEPTDLTEAEANLDDLGSKYLSGGVELAGGSSVRSVGGGGELVGASAGGPLSEVEGRVVGLRLPGAVPSLVGSGSLVDVWAQPEQTG